MSSKKQTPLMKILTILSDSENNATSDYMEGRNDMAKEIAESVKDLLPEERTGYEEMYCAAFTPREKFQQLAKKQAEKLFESTFHTEEEECNHNLVDTPSGFKECIKCRKIKI